MSKVSYIRKPNAQRTVKYTYFYKNQWHNGEHICFEKTDDGAIASCYKSVVVTYMPEFHVTEITTKIV